MMHSGDQRQLGDAQRRLQLVLWFALVISVGVYYVVMRVAGNPESQEFPSLVTGLLLVAVALVGASFLIKSRFAERRSSDPQEKLPPALLGQILAMGLCDAAAVLGVVVWFVTGSPQAYYFLVLALAGMLLHYPRRPA